MFVPCFRRRHRRLPTGSFSTPNSRYNFRTSSPYEQMRALFGRRLTGARRVTLTPAGLNAVASPDRDVQSPLPLPQRQQSLVQLDGAKRYGSSGPTVHLLRSRRKSSGERRSTRGYLVRFTQRQTHSDGSCSHSAVGASHYVASASFVSGAAAGHSANDCKRRALSCSSCGCACSASLQHGVRTDAPIVHEVELAGLRLALPPPPPLQQPAHRPIGPADSGVRSSSNDSNPTCLTPLINGSLSPMAHRFSTSSYRLIRICE